MCLGVYENFKVEFTNYYGLHLNTRLSNLPSSSIFPVMLSPNSINHRFSLFQKDNVYLIIFIFDYLNLKSLKSTGFGSSIFILKIFSILIKITNLVN